MSIHAISIDKLLEAMPQRKRNKCRQAILKLIYSFDMPEPPLSSNVRSFKDLKKRKERGATQLIR